jgi:hypothetical protein
MTDHTPRGFKEFALAIFYGLTMSFSSMAFCVAVVMVMPFAGPLVWLAIPLSVFTGMVAIHRRLPDYSYPIGLLFVPIVGAVLTFAALQVGWTILGYHL